MNGRARTKGARGFTLIEALVSVALMAAIVSMLAAVTSQWMPNWRRGFERVQRSQSLDLGLQRIAADLAAAEFVPPNGEAAQPLLVGAETSAIFVRAAVGPGAAPRLEAIRLSESVDGRGFAMVRERAPFAPVAAGAPLDSQLHFADAVPLVRAPYRVSFSYAGQDRVWQNVWKDSPLLPAAVRISVRDALSDQILAVSVATPLHVGVAADCVRQKSPGACAAGVAAAPEPEATPAPDATPTPDASDQSPPDAAPAGGDL